MTWEIEFERSDKGGDFPVLPPEKYKCKIESVELKSKKDSPDEKYFEWILSVVDGTYSGSPIKTITTLKKGKRWALWALLNAIDVNVGGEKAERISFQQSDVIGKELIAITDIKADMYKGEERKKTIVKKFEVAIPF